MKSGYMDDPFGCTIAIEIVDETISGKYVIRRKGGASYMGDALALVPKEKVEVKDNANQC